MIISPETALEQTLNADSVIKKSMILTKDQHGQVQKLAKTKLKSKLYRIYIAKKASKTVGIGVLLTQTVRSKSTAVLYIMNPQGVLQAIEIISFREPKEYLPSKRWLTQFKDHKGEHFSSVSGNIDNISGATLSANAIIRAANLAQAIYKVALKK
jgi:Na+-translocating ferredoxin:NAD+ oxidoreductase RnfG subunit